MGVNTLWIINLINDNIYFKKFVAELKLTDNTTNESDLQRVFKFPTSPRDSKIHSDKEFTNIDNGSLRELIGLVFISKMTRTLQFKLALPRKHSILIVVEQLALNFY